MEILEKTAEIYKRYQQLEALIISPEIIAHNSYYLKLASEMRALQSTAVLHKELLDKVSELNFYQKEAVKSPELSTAIDSTNGEIAGLVEKIKASLTVCEAAQSDSAILLHLQATKSSASEIFCKDLCEMYKAYAKNEGFSLTTTANEATKDGVKLAVFAINGESAYAYFGSENGVHKSVASKESRDKDGGIVCVTCIRNANTNTVISEKDIRIDVFHASGAGGQNINKVQTAIRITHMPTGIVVTCQDERSQIKNRERALATLQEKIDSLDQKQRADAQKSAVRAVALQAKKNDILRTYNYDTDVVNDNKTSETQSLTSALCGNIKALTSANWRISRQDKLVKRKIW